MKLYVMRHGPAEVRRPGLADEARSLTDEGAEDVRRAAVGLGRLKVNPRRILTSPVKRAFQTAEIVAKAMGLTEQLAIADVLSAGSSPDAILQSLGREAEDLMNEPELGVGE